MPGLKVYMSVALNGLPGTHREMMLEFAAVLEDHYELLRFCPAGTEPSVVYEHDMQCVADCDFMVAFCDKPSLGLGFEMGSHVREHGKPLLILAEDLSKVSPFILGITHPKCEKLEYRHFGDALQKVVEFVGRHFPNHSH